MTEDLRVELEKAYRIAHMESLAEDTTRGHISLRRGDCIYIKPWGIGFDEVTAQRLLGVDLEGKLVEGQGRLHSELPIHLEIYRRREEIISVVHVHPFHSVLLSALFVGRIQIVGQNGMHFGGGVPFYESLDLIRSKGQGRTLAETLGDRPVVLMKNHGIVTVGRSLEEAVILAIDFEKTAREHRAISLFKKPMLVPPEVAEEMNVKLFIPEQYRMMWEYYCRKLD
jgi:L-ribulose-5-phosphate 4-epimerase